MTKYVACNKQNQLFYKQLNSCKIFKIKISIFNFRIKKIMSIDPWNRQLLYTLVYQCISAPNGEKRVVGSLGLYISFFLLFFPCWPGWREGRESVEERPARLWPDDVGQGTKHASYRALLVGIVSSALLILSSHKKKAKEKQTLRLFKFSIFKIKTRARLDESSICVKCLSRRIAKSACLNLFIFFQYKRKCVNNENN